MVNFFSSEARTMKLGIATHVASFVRPVARPSSLARYVTDVTTTAATYSEAEHTARAVALAFATLEEKIREEARA
jgi:hypothetical protein